MIIDDLILKYGIAIPKRYRLREKLYFLDEISKDYKELGYQVKLVMKKGPMMRKAYNLIVGDLEHAKHVIVSYYDTPQRDFGNPILYYPLDGQSTFVSTLLPYYMPLILGAAIIFYMYFIWVPKIDWVDHSLMSFIIVAIIVLVSFFALIFTIGLGNKNNLNRNSSGVIANLLLAEQFKDRKDVAFVLVDKGCTNHFGDDALKERLDFLKINPNIIILDCLGVGKRFGVGYKNKSKTLAHNISSRLGTDTLISEFSEDALKYSAAYRYDKVITICRGKKKYESIVVENTATKKDCDIDIEALKHAVEAIAASL